MRTRRQFQPTVDGLSYRIAPSGLIATPALSLLLSHETFASHAAALSHTVSSSHVVLVSHVAAAAPTGPTMSADDTTMPQTGTFDPVIAAPPPSGGDGTQLC
jgi:hypothetical protein